jgi:hypothetical protein
MMQRLPGRVLVAVALGGLLGVVCARVVLVGSGLALVPWALVGVGVALLGRTRRGSAGLGATYGASLTLAFMVASYEGHASVLAVAGLDLGLACVGAACGAALALAGTLLRRRE